MLFNSMRLLEKILDFVWNITPDAQNYETIYNKKYKKARGELTGVVMRLLRSGIIKSKEGLTVCCINLIMRE